jgi:hypothetical protein
VEQLGPFLFFNLQAAQGFIYFAAAAIVCDTE